MIELGILCMVVAVILWVSKQKAKKQNTRYSRDIKLTAEELKEIL